METNGVMLGAFCRISCFCLLAHSALGAVSLYQETFDQAGTLHTSRWLGYYDSTAKTLNNTAGTAELYYRGNINDSVNNWTTNATYAYIQSRGTEAAPAIAMNYLLMASGSKPSVQLNQYQQLSAAWANYGSGNSTPHRIAAQVDDQWYVSTQKTMGGSISTVSTLAFDATTWTPLLFSPGVQLQLGSQTVSAQSLFGDGEWLQNMGFYVEAAGTTSYMTQRFGDLTLVGEAVPEPQVLMLLGVGLMGVMSRRSRP